MSEVDEGLRARKKRATREAIHRAALDLVEEHGLGAVTTEQIAAQAGVSPRTLFNYFATKQDAVLGLREKDVLAAADWLERRPPQEPPLDGVLAALTRILTPPDADPALRRRRREVLFGEPDLVTSLVRNNIAIERSLIAALERRYDVEPGSDLRLRVIVAASLAVLRSCIALHQNPQVPEFDAAVSQAFGHLRDGLA